MAVKGRIGRVTVSETPTLTSSVPNVLLAIDDEMASRPIDGGDVTGVTFFRHRNGWQYGAARQRKILGLSPNSDAPKVLEGDQKLFNPGNSFHSRIPTRSNSRLTPTLMGFLINV